LDDKPSNTASRKDQKRLEAERRQKLSPLKKKISQAEELMKSLQVEAAALEQQLSDNDLYDASRKDDLTKVLAEKARVDAALEDAEFAWFQAEEQLENLLQELGD
jgi:ATP-binding cassette subfamily F protein 3